MKAILATLAALVAVCAALVGIQSPASAAQCHTVGPIKACGVMEHYSPDDGYDEPIFIDCNWGSDSLNDIHKLYEGHSSKEFCPDMDGYLLHTGEELWCKLIINVSGGGQQFHWEKMGDATGWHQIHDDTVPYGGAGCTLRAD